MAAILYAGVPARCRLRRSDAATVRGLRGSLASAVRAAWLTPRNRTGTLFPGSASVTAMSVSGDIYTAPAADVSYDLVRQFVLDAEQANLFAESVTFEAKESRNGINVAKAVAALSNTDGGIVLLGVKDKDASGEARIAGVPKTELNALVSALRSQIPEAVPEIIPVRIPGTDKLVLVLRINADDVPHPVMVNGTVYYRLAEQSVPADRYRVLDLAERDKAAATAQRGRMDVPDHSGPAAHLPLWPDELDQTLPEPAVTGTLRVAGGLNLPRRILDRPWLDSQARQATLDALNNCPLRHNPAWSTTTWTITQARATFLRLRSAQGARAETGSAQHAG
jgi:hypothetical protein